MEINKHKPEIKPDAILLPLPVKMEEDKEKLNEIIWKGTKRKNSFSVNNLRKKKRECESSSEDEEKFYKNEIKEEEKHVKWF